MCYHMHTICIEPLKFLNEEREYFTMLWILLTLTVLVATTDAQWEGMGDVGSARY